MLKKRKVSKLAEGVWTKHDFLERIDIIYLEYVYKIIPIVIGIIPWNSNK